MLNSTELLWISGEHQVHSEKNYEEIEQNFEKKILIPANKTSKGKLQTMTLNTYTRDKKINEYTN